MCNVLEKNICISYIYSYIRRITHFQEWNYKDYFRKFCHTQFFMFTKCLIIQCLKWLMMLKILKARQKSIILSWSLSNPSLSLSSFLWYGMPFKFTRYMNWYIIYSPLYISALILFGLITTCLLLLSLL